MCDVWFLCGFNCAVQSQILSMFFFWFFLAGKNSNVVTASSPYGIINFSHVTALFWATWTRSCRRAAVCSRVPLTPRRLISRRVSLPARRSFPSNKIHNYPLCVALIGPTEVIGNPWCCHQCLLLFIASSDTVTGSQLTDSNREHKQRDCNDGVGQTRVKTLYADCFCSFWQLICLGEVFLGGGGGCNSHRTVSFGYLCVTSTTFFQTILVSCCVFVFPMIFPPWSEY